MKKYIYLIGAIFSSALINAQVGINTETPKTTMDISAKRNSGGTITDNTQSYGLQAPRLTRAELTANTATYGTDQNGALIYITDVSGGNATAGSQREYITAAGYYYFDAAANKWQKVINSNTQTVYNAGSGLTMTGNNVKLGGTLTESTTVNQGNNPLTFTGASNVNIKTTSNSVFPLAITHPLGNNRPGLWIGGESGTPAVGQTAYIGLNPNESYAGWPILVGAEYISSSTGQGSADFYVATSSGGSASKKLVVKNGGNVGIGTTAPAVKLEVNNGSSNGAIRIVDGTQGDGKVLTSDSDGTGTWKALPASTATNGLTMTGTATKLGGALTENTTVAQNTNTMAFTSTATTGTSHFTVDGTTLNVDAANDRIGIGTAAPATRLEVNNGTTAGAVKIVDGTQGASKVLTSDANGVGTWQALPTPTAYTATNGLTMTGTATKLGGTLTENTTVAQNTNTMAFTSTATTGTSHFTVDGTTLNVDAANNRVGIGTAAPTTRLEVNNGTTAGAVKIVDGTQGADKVLVSDADGVGTWKALTISRSMVLGTFPSPGVTVTPTGSGPIYSNVYIELTKGKWVVNLGITLPCKSTDTSAQRFWVHAYLSTSQTSRQNSGFTYLGPAGDSTAYAGIISKGSGSYSGDNSLNFLTGASVIDVTSSSVKIYLLIEKKYSDTWEFATSSLENYFYAVPIN